MSWLIRLVSSSPKPTAAPLGTTQRSASRRARPESFELIALAFIAVARYLRRTATQACARSTPSSDVWGAATRGASAFGRNLPYASGSHRYSAAAFGNARTAWYAGGGCAWTSWSLATSDP